MIRITSGKFKNTLLDVAKEISRPLTDRIRTSVFDILAPYLENTKILDLYAGSGAMGLEAISREAKSVVFVDNSKEVCNIIEKNIKKLDPSFEWKIENMQSSKFINSSNSQFDIIFLDPPFSKTHRIDIDSLSKLTHSDSIVVLRTSLNFYRKEKHQIKDSEFELKYSKEFGQSIVIFYRPKINL